MNQPPSDSSSAIRFMGYSGFRNLPDDVNHQIKMNLIATDLADRRMPDLYTLPPEHGLDYLEGHVDMHEYRRGERNEKAAKFAAVALGALGANAIGQLSRQIFDKATTNQHPDSKKAQQGPQPPKLKDEL